MLAAVAAEICMMPRGPAVLCAFASPQLSRYAMASSVVTGNPLDAAADLNSACSVGSLVMRLAPGRASASRMMPKVCDSIIRSVRRASISLERSSRAAPMPETRCSGVNCSGGSALERLSSAARRPSRSRDENSNLIRISHQFKRRVAETRYISSDVSGGTNGAINYAEITCLERFDRGQGTDAGIETLSDRSAFRPLPQHTPICEIQSHGEDDQAGQLSGICRFAPRAGVYAGGGVARRDRVGGLTDSHGVNRLP